MSVRHALLALLSEGPKYGLQLRQEFEARTGEVWPLNVGQVYTTLGRLERDGLVASDDPEGGDGRQKRFLITEPGEHELAAWLTTPSELTSPPRDELVIKVLVATGVPGVDVADVIQAHRRHLVELMQQWTRLKNDEAEHDLNLALVIDAELFRLDSAVRWLDAAGARLARAAADAEDRSGRGPEVGPAVVPAEPSPDARATPSAIEGAAMSVLELRGVSKSYGEGDARVDAVRDVDLVVEAGDLVAIMGPSGSGKSTLLTIAGGLEEASAGQVRVDGSDLTAMTANQRAALRRRSLGYVFQDFNLLPGLTAAENVALPLELDGLAARKARVAGLAALDELGLGARADRFPDELSGGERQRVAIARALVGDRRLLLADEPSGALDSVNGEAVLRLVRAACQRGVAGVIVTHDAQLASWADRVVFLRDGHITDQTAPLPGPETLLASEPRR